MRLSSVGERAVINNILKIVSKSFPVSDIPLGDDAAAFKLGGSWLILKVDGSSANTSKYGFMSWYDFGWRVASAAVTDVIAKGGRPLGMVSSIGVPRDYDESTVYEIVSGVSELASSLNTYILGGDINESLSDVWLDVAVVGLTDRFIPATGLRPGEQLLVTSCLGLSAIPYIIYVRGLDPTPWTDTLNIIWRLKPPIDFLDIVNYVKSSTDISDGLASISRMLDLNSVGLAIDEFPLCRRCLEFAEEVGVDELEFIKFLGEEFQIAFTSDDTPTSKYLKLGTITDTTGIVIKGRRADFGWEYFKGYR